ncbi:YncE family protein [Rhodococcus aerolatus]
MLGLLTTDPAAVVLVDLDRPAATTRTVPLPGPGARIVANGAELLIPVDGAVIRIDASAGTSRALPVVGDLRSVVVLADGRLGVGSATGEVRILDAAGGTEKSVTGLAGADDLAVVGNDLLALDRAQSALVGIDLGAAALGAALRAGEGAARATTNGADRVVVTDPARGELLVFSTGPVLLRQRYPVPGAPWAVAVDPANDRAWVTLTATNELVSYDLAGPEPVEQRRVPTVAQPDSVAVDPTTGTVYVGSGTGQLQVVTPSTTAPPP